MRAWALIVTATILCGCNVSNLGDRVVMDQLLVLKDGESNIFKLSPGSYRLELTASNDGASVEWIGGECQPIPQTKSMTSHCRLSKTGQLIISNPTALGLGASTSCTVKVTKLGRDL